MLSLERQRRLLQDLRQHGTRGVVELADALAVSPSTVRRDLREMNDRGLLTRVHGGASLPGADLEPALSSRETEHSEEKRRIGRAAARYVTPGATVLITGGSTTEAMLPHIVDVEGLTVVTNGLNIALHLARHPQVVVVVLGGVLRHDEKSLLGPIAEQVLREFHVDTAFSSAFGVDAAAGLSGANVTEAGTDRRMLQSAGSLVVLADGSKLGRRGPVRLAEVEQITHLVTDDGAPGDVVGSLRARGVEVVTC